MSKRRQTMDATPQLQRAIAQLGRAMASNLELKAVFREFAGGIKDYIPYDRVLITRVDPEKKIARIFLLSSAPQDTIDAPADLYRSGKSVTEWVVQQRKPFIRQDTAAQRDFETDERLAGLGFRSYISIPLIYSKHVVGTFHIASKQPQAYGQTELAFLTSTGEWLAIAMENARLFQETHRLFEEQGVLHQVISQINILNLDSLLQRLTDAVVSIFKTDCAYVRLKEPGGGAPLKAITGANPDIFKEPQAGSGTGMWILEHRKPMVIRDMTDPAFPESNRQFPSQLGFRSFLGVPILLKEEAIGVIVALSRTVRDFTERDLFFLQQLAAEAAVAIHHALLFDELKQLNENLERSSQQKSQFLARLSHEMRTPLSVIIGLVDCLNMDAFGRLDHEQKAVLEKIQRQSRTLIKMANDVLNLSRIEAGAIPVDVSTFSLEKLIESLQTLTEDLQRKTRLKATWDVDPDLPALTSDPGKLEEILQNLIVNAFKYTSQGEVRISIKNPAEADFLQFVVQDTGRGIAPENIPKIFAGFQQVDPTATTHGVGLGLAIVKKYVDLLKGTIEVQSEPGKGSTFTVTLPHVLQS